MELIKMEDAVPLWRVTAGFPDGNRISASDVVEIELEDPDFIKVNQRNGEYILIFHSGRPQYMEVVAQ